MARVAAWKLGQYGVTPDADVTLTTALSGQNLAGKSWEPGEQMTVAAIHGHRDGYNTLCPGDAFYAGLGTVRTPAAGTVTGLTRGTITGTSPVGTTRVLRPAALRPHLRRRDQRLRDLPQPVRSNPPPRTPPQERPNEPPAT